MKTTVQTLMETQLVVGGLKQAGVVRQHQQHAKSLLKKSK
jgi:hypothetical protein